MGDLKPKYVVLLLLGAVLLSGLLHLPFVSNPPYGKHLESQVNSLAVADNFYYEDNSILYPRLDSRGNTDGVFASHFPLYEYLLAQAYFVVGNQYWVHRILTWLFSVVGALAIFFLTRLWFRSDGAAVISFYFYLFSPEIFYNGFIALPEILALALVLWGLVFFYQWWYKRRNFQWILSIVFFLMGALIKLPFLGIGFIVMGTLLRDWKPLSKNDWLHLGTGAVLVIFPVLIWQRYANGLADRSGIAGIHLKVPGKEKIIDSLELLKQNIFIDMPDMVLGYIACIGFLAAIYYFILKKNRTDHYLFLPLASFLGIMTVYHFFEIQEKSTLQHYLMPYLVFLVPVSAYGLLKLTRSNGKLWMILLGAHVLLCSFRIIPFQFATGDKGLPKEFWHKESRVELQSSIPAKSLIIAGKDPSSSVYLYFLKSQGWTFSEQEQLSGNQASRVLPIDSLIRSGASYIVSDDSLVFQNPVVWSRLGEKKAEVGNFKVFRLRQVRK